MSTPPTNLPRVVPTLTEVVSASGSVPDDLLQELLLRVNVELEQRVRAEVAQALTELQPELERLVREVLAQLLAARSP